MSDLNLERFDAEFEAGVNNAATMGKKRQFQTIISLCQGISKNKKIQPTIGKAQFVPILDKKFSAIHHLKNFFELMVPVINPQYDGTNSKIFWRQYTCLSEDSYICPLTAGEREKIKRLQGLMEEYGNNYSKFGFRPRQAFFMKVFMIKIKSDAAGDIYADLTEPVIIRHNSTAFPEAYAQMCKVNDDNRGKGWRRDLYLPDGDVMNYVVCTTSTKDIGYNVSFNYMNGIKTGKVITREELTNAMDYDINTIGFDDSCFDDQYISEAIRNIDASFELRSHMDSNGNYVDDVGSSSSTSTSESTANAQELGELLL